MYGELTVETAIAAPLGLNATDVVGPDTGVDGSENLVPKLVDALQG